MKIKTMKKILLLINIVIVSFLSICCSNSNDDDSTPQTQPPVNKTIPSELLGSWKINYVALAKDPDFVTGNDIGYFIKFNTDNSIEYKDGNKFGGVNSINKVNVKQMLSGDLSSLLTVFIDNMPTSIDCRNSYKYKGQVEFKILYPANSGMYDMILIGTKQ